MLSDNLNNTKKIPRHIAIIMDGNGRWAMNQKKTRFYGHKAGIKSVRRAINFAIKNNIYVLTLYAFSSENWSRSIKEVNSLIKLLFSTLERELDHLNKYNICLKVIGDISKFDIQIQECIKKAERLTQYNKGLLLNIAVNYGGRWDILQGIKKIIYQVQKGNINPEKITEESLNSFFSLRKIVPVDLVIRTGGEFRISNFLLWQIAYAEFWFTDVLWPDFNEYIFKKALYAFSLRERKYGGNI
ncbi:polyprenyl diphosphate synthase [Candidatus Tachikawaea gelatinosa]|uniref:Ditrans,polycis-undecaprenyl-diphosphate synthase ((2E,6E)-farnesyl-diphosphate specific) n=1 Tax=Candidatus Tachikawaea gelatinosa TaxID=1410383 RepID=A0A090AIY9_9ENTR|nr:polyprenyl diphosphate synthase [Candidatus Tachikawaea gelatinosa]BAP58398.1 ditrans polycis-undecaprenyl-diphosphate synthase ((2E 6E)-farnesyl-diphosphate specific) [Candidatus Tachikawaea gelatinosa]